jgi:hypothetical protein
VSTTELLRTIDRRLAEVDAENILAAFRTWERRRDDAIRRHNER